MPTVFAIFKSSQALVESLNTQLRFMQLGVDINLVVLGDLEPTSWARLKNQQMRARFNLELVDQARLQTILSHYLAPNEIQFIVELLNTDSVMVISNQVDLETGLLNDLSDLGAVHLLVQTDQGYLDWKNQYPNI